MPLPETAADEGPLSRLTPREREVLEPAGQGATNKTIASALVISEKTVSVHVSNVLSKLGVENRGAARPSPVTWCIPVTRRPALSIRQPEPAGVTAHFARADRDAHDAARGV